MSRRLKPTDLFLDLDPTSKMLVSVGCNAAELIGILECAETHSHIRPGDWPGHHGCSNHAGIGKYLDVVPDTAIARIEPGAGR